MTDLLMAFNTVQAALAELEAAAKRARCPALMLEAVNAQGVLSEAFQFDIGDDS